MTRTWAINEVRPKIRREEVITRFILGFSPYFSGFATLKNQFFMRGLSCIITAS
jgi:hypothetical protein